MNTLFSGWKDNIVICQLTQIVLIDLNTASIKMPKIFLECERAIFQLLFSNIRVKNTFCKEE